MNGWGVVYIDVALVHIEYAWTRHLVDVVGVGALGVCHGASGGHFMCSGKVISH